MTAFQDYIAAQFPFQTDWYRMGDPVGATTLHNSGTFGDAVPTNLNGAVVLGQGPHFFDGKKNEPYVSQDKDTVMAVRADSAAFYDRPANTHVWTAIVLWRPKKLKKGDGFSTYGLINKGLNVYGLGVRNWTAYVVTIGGLELVTPGDMIAPMLPQVVVANFDSDAGTMKVWQDGEVIGSRSVTVGTAIAHTSGGNLQVAGYNAFGNNGPSADFMSIINLAGSTITDAQVKELTRLALTDEAFEPAGDDRMVFSWDRPLVTASTYTRIRITNPSRYPVWLKQAASGSVLRGGWYLHPYGGSTGWVGNHPDCIVNYTGAWCGRHEGRNGGQRLSIVKRND